MSEMRLPRVLVVDDEARVRDVLCEALETWGLAADSAADSAQALELFARGDYDLVLTDFLMPGGTRVRRAPETAGVRRAQGRGQRGARSALALKGQSPASVSWIAASSSSGWTGL